MPQDLKELEAQLLRLPLRDRAALVERLLVSLDSMDDGENERLWVEEAERRYQAYKKGEIAARPAADVMRDARKAIR